MTPRRRRSIAALAFGATGLLALPFVVMNGTLASWNDAEYAYGEVGTSSFDCADPDAGHAARAAARLIGAHVLDGLDIGSAGGLAEVNGLTLERTGEGDASVDPPGALDLSPDADTSTFLNTLLNAGALGGAVTIGLPQLTLPLQQGNDSTGALSEYTSAASTGDVKASSGLVTSDGGLNVAAAQPSDGSMPTMATLGLQEAVGSLIPGLDLTPIADLALEIGAVEGHSIIDGCELLRSDAWGEGSVTADRGYWIAGLGLGLESPLVGQVVTPVATGLPSAVQAVLAPLTGADGGIAGGILSSVDGLLNAPLLEGLGLNLANVTGNVAITGLDLGPVQALLTETISDPSGILSMSLGTGAVRVDVAGLLGRLDPETNDHTLNGLAPNTELLLDDEVLDALATATGEMLDAWATEVVDALEAAIRAATVDVDLNVNLSVSCRNLLGILAAVCLALPSDQVSIATVHVGVDGSVGAVIDGSDTGVVTAVSATLLQGSLVGQLLNVLGVTAVTNALTSGLVNPLLGTVVGAVASPLVGALSTTTQNLGGLLLNAPTGVVPQLASDLLSPLVQQILPTLLGADGLLSIGVNIQPDLPLADPGGNDLLEGTSYIPAVPGVSTAEYAETALRIGIADLLSGRGGAVVIELAHASAGPVTAP